MAKTRSSKRERNFSGSSTQTCSSRAQEWRISYSSLFNSNFLLLLLCPALLLMAFPIRAALFVLKSQHASMRQLVGKKKQKNRYSRKCAVEPEPEFQEDPNIVLTCDSWERGKQCRKHAPGKKVCHEGKQPEHRLRSSAHLRNSWWSPEDQAAVFLRWNTNRVTETQFKPEKSSKLLKSHELVRNFEN